MHFLDPDTRRFQRSPVADVLVEERSEIRVRAIVGSETVDHTRGRRTNEGREKWIELGTVSAQRPSAGTFSSARGGVFEHLLGSTLLDHHPCVHEHDAVGDLLREADLMRDDHHGHSLAGQRAHHVEDLTDEFGIERRCRLIEQHHLRLHAECPSNRNPLLLTTGKMGGIVVGLVGEPDPLEHFASDADGLRLGATQHACLGNREILQHRQMREQIELLEHHADVRAELIDIGIWVGDVLAVDQDLTPVRLLESIETPKQGGLPGS